MSSPHPEELESLKETVARILPNPEVSQDGGRGGALKDQHRGWSCIRPTVGGRPLHRVLKGLG